jgi:hypothetical protein
VVHRSGRRDRKALSALAIVTGGAVVAFAIYAFAWHNARNTPTRAGAQSQRVYTLTEGDAVLVPDAAVRCEVSGEAGVPNFYCAHTGQTGYQVFLWKDRADLYDLARHGEPMVPTYSVDGLRLGSCGALNVGIGWRLRASPNVECSFARHLMISYFKSDANRRAAALVLGYVCTRRDLRDGEHIRCVNAARVVEARSFGY